MPIHKLAEGPITITVVSAEVTEGNYGSQVKFVGEGDVLVFVSELTAAKQLARLNHTIQSIVGQTIYMEQVKKNGTTFTNIALAASGTAPSAPAPRPAQTYAPAPKMTVAEASVIYGECVTYAMGTLGAKCEEAGIPIDASAIQAAAATLFIKVTR